VTDGIDEGPRGSIITTDPPFRSAAGPRSWTVVSPARRDGNEIPDWVRRVCEPRDFRRRRRPDRWRHDRRHQRQSRRSVRCCAAGSDGHDLCAADARRADRGDQRRRQLSLSRHSARHLSGVVRAARLRAGRARRDSRHARIHRDTERHDAGLDAAGNRDGHRRHAGRRRVVDQDFDQLRLQGARLDPERARHVGDSRRVAGRHDVAHRRRRQCRGNAERLSHLRRARRSEPRDDRRPGHDRRHRRDRRLRRLRCVRGSDRRHGRPRRRHGPARRADADDHQVGRQRIPRHALRRLPELGSAGHQHHRRAGRAQHPRQGRQPDEGLLRLQRRRRRLPAQGQGLVVRLVPRVQYRDQRAAIPGAPAPR
jgi:hypothetical protein